MMALPSRAQFQTPITKESWVGGFLRTLNQFIIQAVDSLQSLIDAQPRYRDLQISTGAAVADSFPIEVDNPLPRPPVDVHVAKVQTSGDSITLSAVTILWQLTATGQIQVTSVTGLDTDSAYVIRVSIQ